MDLIGTVAVLRIEGGVAILKNMFVKSAYRGKASGVSNLLQHKHLHGVKRKRLFILILVRCDNLRRHINSMKNTDFIKSIKVNYLKIL